MRYGLVIMLFLSAAVICSAQTQTQKPPCSDPEYRQFDFWVGEWNVDVKGKPAGTSSVQLILDQCIVFENWTGKSGYTGKSFNTYNSTLKKWQQFWVDNQGGSLQFSGEYKDGALRLIGETPQPDGSKVIEHLTFFKLPDGRVRQLWEQSNDNGKTWTVAFDGNYVRKK